MGGSTGSGKVINTFNCSAPVALCNHKSQGQSGDATTVAYVKNSTFSFGFKYVNLFQCIGTGGDPITISGNTCNNASGSTSIDGINCYGSYCQYVTIDSNVFNTRGTIVDISNIAADVAGLSVTNNTGTAGLSFVSGNAPAGPDAVPALE